MKNSNLYMTVYELTSKRLTPAGERAIVEAYKADVRQSRTNQVQHILDLTCHRTRTTPEELCNKSHLRYIADARHIFCYLSRKHTDSSQAAIGLLIRKDHSSVKHGVGKIETLMTCDKGIKQIVADIETLLTQ